MTIFQGLKKFLLCKNTKSCILRSKLMEFRTPALISTYMPEDIFKYLQSLVYVRSHASIVVRVRAYCYYFSAKFTEAAEKVGGRKKINAFINAAGVYLHALALGDECTHYLIGDITVLCVF